MRKLFSIIIVGIVLIMYGCGGAQDDLSEAVTELKTESYAREPYRLELSYPADELVFGNSAEVVLKIEYPENETYILLPPAIDSSKSTANTVIVDINESEPLLNGNGTAVSTITFNVEAWLPGELVFPSLSVSFGEVLTTDEFVISVTSAFDNDEDERELSPLYIPETDTSVSWMKRPAALGIGVVLIAVVIVFILFLRHRKKNAADILPVKTREEMIDDFKKNYIDTTADIDLRAAFSALGRLTGLSEDEQGSSLINEARFSRNGIPANEGRILLIEVFQKFIKESDDEL